MEMSIVLFAILGANANVGTGYWICFAIYCAFYMVRAFKEAMEEAW